MNKKIIKIKLFALSFLMVGTLMAQQKLIKTSQSIKVDKEVTIDLNTSYTNIVFDSWNKNVIQIEAYIEGEGLSKEELENALKNWNVDIDATKEKVSIATKDNAAIVWSHANNAKDNDAVHAVLEELKFELADIPEMDFDMDFDFNFEMPELPEMPEMPEMQDLPELPEGISEIQFDYQAYKKDGKKYLEEYTKKFKSTYGDDYTKKMEAWGDKFGKEWGEKYGKQMEEWAKNFDGKWEEKFGKKMEVWGERFAKQMEKQAHRNEEQKKHTQDQAGKLHELNAQHDKHVQKRIKLADDRRILIEKLVRDKSPTNIKKTIKIKMPKKSKLKVNVRHGELKFAATIDNLKANLSHTKFSAYSINGSSTSINASYSPIFISHWNVGELNLNYVKNAEINNVKRLVLTSNSSNVKIDNLLGNAIIEGSIGNLKILKIDDAFTNLNVMLQNSDAVIALPAVDYNLQYKGNRSRFSHPNKNSNENTSSFSTGNLSNTKTIVVSAKYSNVVMKSL